MSDAPATESFTNNRQTKNEIFSSRCYQKEFELTTHNALRLLQDSGFQTVKDWFQLTESLEVPLDTRRKLNIQAEKCQNYNMALEEGLDWFIANNRNPSWMTLINAVERCNRNVAKTLKSKLKLQGDEEPAAAATANECKLVMENSPIEKVENTCFKLTQVIQIVLLASFLCWMFGFWIGLAMSLIILLIYLLCKLIYFAIKCILKKAVDIVIDQCTKKTQTKLPILSESLFDKSGSHHSQELSNQHKLLVYFEEVHKPDTDTGGTVQSQCSESKALSKCTHTEHEPEPATIPLTHMSGNKLTGFSRDGKHQRLSDYMRKMVLQGMCDNKIEMINSWVCSSSETDEDMKAIVHLYLGFHYQIKQSSSDENFTRSQQELEKAIEICERSDCKYAEYIMGRAYTYLTQNYYYDGNFEHAKTSVQIGEWYFSFLSDRHEKSGLIYQRVLLGSVKELDGEVLSDDDLTMLGYLMDSAIYCASLDDTYQALSLKCFMLVKKAMLCLGIFNLTHIKHWDRKPEDYKVSVRWLLEAKQCLLNVPQQFLNTEMSEASYYKGLYYFTMSECLRYEKDYKKSFENLNKAEVHFTCCKCAFPQTEIDNRRTFLQGVISTDDRSKAFPLSNI